MTWGLDVYHQAVPRSVRMDGVRVQDELKEYNKPRHEIETQNKVTKLFSLLDEVDQKYKEYCQQLQVVEATLDVVSGCEEHGDSLDRVSPRLRKMQKQLRQQRSLQHLGVNRHSWRLKELRELTKEEGESDLLSSFSKIAFGRGIRFVGVLIKEFIYKGVFKIKSFDITRNKGSRDQMLCKNECKRVIPEIYNEEAYNGNSALYITSSNGYLYKVILERPNEGLWYLSGTKWTEFCNNNLNENVALLHFIKEGDDSFYVTGYTSNVNEVRGYEANRATFLRFMTRVFLYPNLP
nr:hypothetical protein [Tanacetum cinerariifolium]